MALRVAVITESFLPSLNGVTNSVVRVLESLKAGGHEAIVLAPTSPAASYLGFKVTRISRFYIKQFAVALPHLRLAQILQDFKPDVIHVAAPFAFGRQAIAIAKRLNIPSVAIYQTDISGYVGRYGLPGARPLIDRMIGAIHRRATINLAPTAEGAEYLTRIGAKNVSVWARGVDLDNFHPDRRPFALEGSLSKGLRTRGQVVIGFVGRLAAEKQVERFAELFGIKNVSFLIVGDGPERPRLEKLFAGQQVTFTGRLSGLDLAKAYACIDVFVHFGTEETFGQTIQEAQASGLAVVAPNRGGPRFIIQSEVNGILVDPSKPNTYRDAVERLVGSRKLRVALGKAARQAVAGKSWQNNNAELFEHYENSLKMVVGPRR